MQASAQALLAGDLRALARALTVVENEPEAGAALLEALAGRTGRAHRIGVTGPPGAGKSTLVSALVTAWRKAGRKVGVLAVDPSSAFTGGALLGDRIRMTQHLGDAGVFVRSLASRGAAGGLAAAAEDSADLLDAAGFDPVVIETVGVGQGEMDVAGAADTTVLVLAPGGGDDVQALKAGLVEMADIVVVNQADRAGADRLEAALKAAFELRTRGAGLGAGPAAGPGAGAQARPGEAAGDGEGLPGAPPVFLTVATKGEGVAALAEALLARGDGSRPAALAARRLARARRRLREEVERQRSRAYWAQHGAELERLAREVAGGRASAQAAARALLSKTP
ncbi:MAG: methylmalonyl Co-A mutase-associated GTPase MeaB [Planctomycetia bacterium]